MFKILSTNLIKNIRQPDRLSDNYITSHTQTDRQTIIYLLLIINIRTDMLHHLPHKQTDIRTDRQLIPARLCITEHRLMECIYATQQLRNIYFSVNLLPPIHIIKRFFFSKARAQLYTGHTSLGYCLSTVNVIKLRPLARRNLCLFHELFTPDNKL